ncbi:histidine kinase [Mucilaginibacter sabulilitoris]|uniref:Histidine kinase n=1 Tax=Mucilaginibacter sabulilitoris TaxID=1173583 RepID=A0ABZ0TJ59_9SPHI|nr:histidine kinase [Mucilaginibacter sabulilitoris]WPU92851.1 histidine kinase [Mucilaginibacter sabulilitoris]
MKIERLSVRQLQWLIWCGVAMIVFFSTVAEDPLAQALVYMMINVSFYAVIIYGNISFLYPRFYETGRRLEYVIYSALYVCAFAIGRGYLAISIYNHYFAKTPEKITWPLILAFIAGGALDFMMSLIFRIALAYFKLKQQSEEIKVQKSKAELNLLKAQLQPHFLFNTLNNIYYEIYTEAPRSAKLVEQLSEIMRYFTDETPKEQVPLSAEIGFIQNYIALETIRLRYGAEVRLEQELYKDFMVPPMLLMTLVENVFKHGIDPQINKNPVTIKLYDQNGYLYFQTINAKVERAGLPHGLGLKNLRERLSILYDDQFELNHTEENGLFIASLKIPVS